MVTHHLHLRESPGSFGYKACGKKQERRMRELPGSGTAPLLKFVEFWAVQHRQRNKYERRKACYEKAQCKSFPDEAQGQARKYRNKHDILDAQRHCRAFTADRLGEGHGHAGPCRNGGQRMARTPVVKCRSTAVNSAAAGSAAATWKRRSSRAARWTYGLRAQNGGAHQPRSLRRRILINSAQAKYASLQAYRA
jgi:hypothetical protein